MMTISARLASFKLDRRGIAAIEYALIASFMAVVLVVAVPKVTAAITSAFTSIGTHVTNGS